jgi:hypothetical protein
MHEDQRDACPPLDERHVVSIHVQGRHEVYSAALRFDPFRASTGFRYAPV